MTDCIQIRKLQVPDADKQPLELFCLLIYFTGVTMAKELKTSAGGRKCMYPHCKNLLSIYNHENYCHVHRNQVAKERKRKIPYHHPT